MRLYLIRHAQTQPDPQADAAHWLLSPQGTMQAQQLAHQPFWENVTQIVVSSEAKTRLTVAPVLAERTLPLLVDKRFDELQRRGFVSNEEYAAQVQRAFAHPDQPAGDWEPADQARQRVVAGVADLVQQFPSATLALVGHGLSLSLYRAFLLGQQTVDFGFWQRLGFGSVALVDPLAHQLLQDFQ